MGIEYDPSHLESNNKILKKAKLAKHSRYRAQPSAEASPRRPFVVGDEQVSLLVWIRNNTQKKSYTILIVIRYLRRTLWHGLPPPELILGKRKSVPHQSSKAFRLVRRQDFNR